MKSGPNAGLGIPYSPLLVVQAAGLLLKDAGRLKGSDPYQLDIVDVPATADVQPRTDLSINRAAEAFRKKTRKHSPCIAAVFSKCCAMPMNCCVRVRIQF
ncbi:MAG: hypothetical protein ACLRS8_00885 [Parabacteroides merdae]